MNKLQQFLFGWQRAVISVFICCLSIFLTAWLLIHYQLPGNTQFLKALQNSGHALIFFCLSLIICVSLRRLRLFKQRKIMAAVAILICICVNAFVEIIQAGINHQSSWSDLLLDTAGAVAGGLLFISFYTTQKRRTLLIVSVVALLLYSLSSPIYWLYANFNRNYAFPIIADFDNTWLNLYFDTEYSARHQILKAPEEWRDNQSQVIKVDFDTGPWPGLITSDVVRNWGSYHHFVFDIYNPHSQTLELVLRIHDAQHNNRHADRFNRTFNVVPGYTQIKVAINEIQNGPKNRELDIKNIVGFMVYMSHPAQSYTLYFDNFRLE